DLTRRLLEANFPVDMKNDNGQTPLHLVAEIGSLDIGRLLVAHGADALERQSLPETTIHIAAYFGNTALVELLLVNGWSLTQDDSMGRSVAVDGRTPLHCASDAGAGDAVAALLDAGAETNKKNSQGRTA
ncbi:ankyrin, partial [Cadophora sp. DSE1049]